MLTELDLNLKLLRGLPIEVQGIKIYPPTIDDIVEATFEKYNGFLNLLCIDKDSIKNIFKLKEDISAFEFIVVGCNENDEYKNLIFEALQFFLKEKVDTHYAGFLVDKQPMNEEAFNEIVKIIKLQNCLVEKETEEKIKPANERARKMLEQMKKNQEELNKIKAKNVLTFYDLISIFAAYSENINILNVWDLTFFQFNDQFNRLKIMKEYDANLQILMHCDTSKNKVELKHWLSVGK